MQSLLADIRHAIRLYAANPLASGFAVIVLAVAIAFFSAFFSLYSALALKTHPGFERAGELVTFGQSDGTQFLPVRPEIIERIREQVTSLEVVAGVGSIQVPMTDYGSGTAEFVTENFFSHMRPRLQLGRGFDQRDHTLDADPVVVLSHRFWQDHFAGRTNVVGTRITLEARTHPDAARSDLGATVVGVMAPELPGIFVRQADFWVPAELMARLQPIAGGPGSMRGLGRLAQGTAARAVRAELRARFTDQETVQGLISGYTLDAAAGVIDDINVQRDVERQVRLFMAGGALLALVAACNVSLFLLARAPGRRRELGIRMAVGAPLRRLARQLVTEAGVLVIIATGLGVLLSVWLALLLQDAPFLRDANWRNVTADGRVLALVSLLALIVTGLVSLAPVLGLRRLTIADSSRAMTARAGPAQRIAGGVQIAVASTLAAAGLAFTWHLAWLVDQRGYHTANLHVVEARIDTNPAFRNRTSDLSALAALTVVERQRWREVIGALPGVQAVTIASAVPNSGYVFGGPTMLPDNPLETISAGRVHIEPDYLEQLGIRLLHGRVPAVDETNAVMVNETMAMSFWGRTDVIGENISPPFRRITPSSVPGFSLPMDHVVGVVQDVSFNHPAANANPKLFTLEPPALRATEIILIQSTRHLGELRTLLQQRIDDGTLEFEIAGIDTMQALATAAISADRARTTLTVGSALLVVMLAAFGFHGTQHYLVAAGRREYAIRAALGAGPGRLGRMVQLRGLMLGLPGLAFGTVLAFILTAWLRDDFVTAAVSPGVITLCVATGVALLLLAASAGPAHEARRLAPAEQLRDE